MTTQTSVNNRFTNNDLVVSREETAGSVITTITNTDNTSTSSRAYLALETGGASGGDPYISYSTSATSFTYGIDNSDSDSFILSENAALGTTNVAKCNSGSLWTYPLNAAFHVHLNGVNKTNVTGNAALYTIPYDNESFDIGSDFNTGTYTFTAPVSGIYMFQNTFRLNGATTNQYCYSKISGVGFNQKGTAQLHGNMASPPACAICTVVQLDAADTVYAVIEAGGEAANTEDLIGAAGFTYFTGALVS